MKLEHTFTFSKPLEVKVTHVADPIVMAALRNLANRMGILMATAADVKAIANTIKEEVGKFGPAVNSLEKAVTDALAKLPSVPADVQADIDDAFSTLRDTLTSAQAAVADAADGVDENAPQPGASQGRGAVENPT